MNIQKNRIVDSPTGRPVLFDFYSDEKQKCKGLILFIHGFKGFKDWGIWDLLARRFTQNGYAFVKFNFSFNGTTPADPLAFGDLEAFGQNNYSKEWMDIDAVLNHLFTSPEIARQNIDLERLFLIGHSRGGGIGILKSHQDPRIKALVTWAAVNNLAYAWQDEAMVKQWEKEGVYHIINGRTKQSMPLYFQLYEDYLKKRELYAIEKTMRSFSKPCLIVHGTADPAVPHQMAEQMKEWCASSHLELIEGADHVFGGRHPYEAEELPLHAQQLFDKTLNFLERL